MKAKLVKHEVDYYCLLNNKGEVIADVNGGNISKLSLKNCQAIERGYDLDELATEFAEKRLGRKISKWDNVDSHSAEYACFYHGFQKALEILGDRKFSEKELTMLFAYGHQIGMNDVLAIQSQHSPQPMPKPDSDKLRDELIQSLQQNEWEVEVEMEEVNIGDKYTPEPKPKLDTDGCLILKRV